MTGRDIAIALWTVLLLSSNLIVQKIAVAHLSVFVLSFLRVALVAPLLFFFPKPKQSLWKYAVCGFFWSVLYLILFGFALKTNIGAGISAFFIQLQVFFGILCCFLILGEKPTWSQVVGILISFIGVYLLSTSASEVELPVYGMLLLIASCMSFGTAYALMKKFEIGKTLSDITWLSVAATIPLLIATLLFEGVEGTVDIILNMSSIAIFCVLYAVFVSTLWATSLLLGLSHRLKGATVTPFLLLLPVFSVILSYFVFDETLTTYQIFAGSVIILGIMFAQEIHKKIVPFVFWVKERIA